MENSRYNSNNRPRRKTRFNQAAFSEEAAKKIAMQKRAAMQEMALRDYMMYLAYLESIRLFF